MMRGMPWALQRRLLFAFGALAGAVVFGVGSYFFIFYAPPTCFDGFQNQDEEGVDCGGVCALLCEAPNVTVMWARSVQVAPGVYHAVALVRNADTQSSGSISYQVSVFDADNILITTRDGTLTLGPGEVAPLFEANVVVGERTPARTFVDISEGRFERAERTPSPVRILSFTYDAEALRLEASIENQTVTAVPETRITALLFNQEDVLIGASQTLSGALAPGERKQVFFTWQAPFDEEVVRTDIIPRAIYTQ